MKLWVFVEILLHQKYLKFIKKLNYRSFSNDIWVKWSFSSIFLEHQIFVNKDNLK